ncbi:unnamed protein product [Cuscuta campestris]|uniref:Amino acid transporter transmembrane domain-containing protein n=1 Tax=Cuscuta campestris TaxID=132261 RepID=A0A484KRF5_9ASTE|nr:unnamed protein product [Cuscuta campestris]
MNIGPQGESRVRSDHQGGDEVVKKVVDDEDAGALFVLKSKGSWWHCGYHLTTSIVAPPLLSLPFAFAMLGWVAGIVCLVAGAVVTFYSYNLTSLVLEHNAHHGRRLLRYRDMATLILGAKWGKYFVGPIQLLVCYGAVIGSILLGGQCLKTIYMMSNPKGGMKLYEFVNIVGVASLILGQFPSFHSLRHINFLSLLLTLCYSACATVGSISIGLSSKGPKRDYSLSSDNETRVFGVFSAVGIIATTFGNGIIPEIQATLAPPVKGKMFKGLCICYSIVTTTFFSVTLSGYWAFGNKSQEIILNNFTHNGKNLVPKAFILISNLFVLVQLCSVAVVYLQPTNEMLERAFGDPKSKEFSARNLIPRVITRSLSVIVATAIAATLPFYGDMAALIGAIGFMPLDFVLPVVFFNLTFKPSKKSVIFWVNVGIAVVFSILGVIAAVAAVRQIILDAKTYTFFS